MAQPKFEFRLEALLTVRKNVEQEKLRKFAAVQQEIAAQKRMIEQVRDQIVAENRTLTGKELTGKLDMAYIAHEKRYVGNLQVKILMGLQKLAGMEQSLVTARAELLEAARQRKVIEKLREKQLARWRAELDRKETAQMDEIGTQLTIRRAAEEAAR